MNKVEKMKIEGYIDNLEEEIEKVYEDMTNIEFYIKQLKRHIKECEVKSEEENEDD